MVPKRGIIARGYTKGGYIRVDEGYFEIDHEVYEETKQLEFLGAVFRIYSPIN